MHPRLQEVFDYAERARTDLLTLLTEVTPDEWESRAGSGGWTVREVVEHLALVESGSVRALFRAFRTARDAGLGQETEAGSVLSSLDWSRLTEVVTPIKAPSFTQPTGASIAELREQLATSRSGLRKFAAEADGYALAGVEFPHPRLGSLNLYQWVLMIGQHERRHLRQIRNILTEVAGTSRFANPAGDAKAAAAGYTAALLDLLGARDPVAVWRELPDEIDRLTSDLTDDEARRPERDGKWCVQQVVSHLVDTETVYGYRVRRIVAEDTPPILGYDQDRWAQRLHYTEESLGQLRTELRVLRTRNLRFIERLSAAERERVGMHDERGPESVWHIVKLLAGHDFVHRNQLARIRRAIGRPA